MSGRELQVVGSANTAKARATKGTQPVTCWLADRKWRRPTISATRLQQSIR